MLCAVVVSINLRIYLNQNVLSSFFQIPKRICAALTATQKRLTLFDRKLAQ